MLADAVGMHELARERRDRRADAVVVGVDERARAERRVAAAAQVEVAFPHPVRRELAGPEHGRAQPRGGAHALERGGGGVELLHRGRRAHRGGALGEQRLFGGEVIHIGAVRRPGERELMAEIGLQSGQAAGAGRPRTGSPRRPASSPQSRIMRLGKPVPGHATVKCRVWATLSSCNRPRPGQRRRASAARTGPVRRRGRAGGRAAAQAQAQRQDRARARRRRVHRRRV